MLYGLKTAGDPGGGRMGRQPSPGAPNPEREYIWEIGSIWLFFCSGGCFEDAINFFGERTPLKSGQPCPRRAWGLGRDENGYRVKGSWLFGKGEMTVAPLPFLSPTKRASHERLRVLVSK